MKTWTRPIPLRLPGYAGTLFCGVLAMTGTAILLSAMLPAREVTMPASSSVNRIVRWHERDHDRLRVTVRATREVVVYDAATGEPLQRLAADAASVPPDRRASAFASR